jgi:hypothetical protein
MISIYSDQAMFMSSEALQLLELLQSIANVKQSTSHHRSILLLAARKFSEDAKKAAWGALLPWQYERLWEIAKSGR